MQTYNAYLDTITPLITILKYPYYEEYPPHIAFGLGKKHIVGNDAKEEYNESGYRAKIILLKDEGYSVPEIRRITNHHDINIRKWIHRFNEQDIEGIISKIQTRKPLKVTDEIEKKIIDMATKNPREGYGLSFSTWSLRVVAGYISKELNLADTISHTEIRNILLKHGIRYIDNQRLFGIAGSRISFEKGIEDSRYGNLPLDSVLLYEDEKGPVTAKTYGGTS